MSTTTYSSRDFNQDTSGAKKAALDGPVIITDRGRPAHVLMAYEQYQALAMPPASIVDLLSMPEADDIEFEPARLGQPFVAADYG